MMGLPTFEIFNCDCVKVFDELAKRGAKFDAIVADPPYCSGAATPAQIARNGVLKYCDTLDNGAFYDSQSQYSNYWFTRLWLTEARKILRPCAYIFIFCDWRQIPIFSNALQAAQMFWRGIAIWKKPNARPNPGTISPNCEFIVWGTVGAEKSDKFIVNSVFEGKAPQSYQRIHPTQKAVEPIEGFLKILPDNAEAVLDPFCGSGATGVAALKSGLNFTGCELDANFAQLAAARLSDALKTLEMTGTLIDRIKADDAPRLF